MDRENFEGKESSIYPDETASLGSLSDYTHDSDSDKFSIASEEGGSDEQNGSSAGGTFSGSHNVPDTDGSSRSHCLSTAGIVPVFSDAEMQKLIREAFIRDTVYDAAIDNFIERLWTEHCLFRVNSQLFADPSTLEYGNEGAMTSISSAKKVLLLEIRLESKKRGVVHENRRLFRMIVRRMKYWGYGPSSPVFSDLLLLEARHLLQNSKNPSPGLEAIWPTRQSEPTSLERTARNQLLSQLSTFVKHEIEQPVMSCGGKLPVQLKKGLAQKLCPRVTIRWDTTEKNASISRAIRFPEASKEQTSTENLQRELFESCHPFELEDADGSAKHSSKPAGRRLGQSSFSTDFNPYEYGIIDATSQLMLVWHDLKAEHRPDRARPQHSCRKFRATLQSLEIFSTESSSNSRRQPVEQSEDYYGHLIICLPSQYQGGGLTIWNGASEQKYRWGDSPSTFVHWAAFSSDCVYRLEQIKSGHCVTLNYRLHSVDGIEQLMLHPLSLISYEETKTHEFLRPIFANPIFLREPGVYGIFCHQNYAHTEKTVAAQFPNNLKGSDLVLYSVLRGLGLEAILRPIIYDDERLGGVGVDEIINGKRQCSTFASKKLEQYRLKGYMTQKSSKKKLVKDKYLTLYYEGEDSSGSDTESPNNKEKRHVCSYNQPGLTRTTFDDRFQHLLKSRRIKGVAPRHTCRDEVIVGDYFNSPSRPLPGGWGNEFNKALDMCEAHVTLPCVVWLNQPKLKNRTLQWSFIMGGSLGREYYSIPAILIINYGASDSVDFERG